MPNRDRVTPPPSDIESTFSFEWRKWFSSIGDSLGNFPLKIPAYSVAELQTGTVTVPAANHGSIAAIKEFSSLVFVYDETGGATLAFSDGTNWRRVQDRVVIS